MSVQWGVGVISCPRDPSTLQDTLDSIARAGWGHVTVSYDAESRGCWWNWKFMLGSLLMLHEDANVLLIFEDDVQVTRGLRDYLEWMDSGDGMCDFQDGAIWSLYCSAANEPPSGVCGGWREVRVPLRAYGALAYMMPRWLGESLFMSSFPDQPNGTDHLIGRYCRDNGIPYYVHSPSFVRHTGEVSTLPPAGIAKNRQCGRFLEKV